MSIKAIIFDLDGVIVTTDNYHYEAWKMLADEKGVYFDRDINERLRGVSRMESLNIVLENSSRVFSEEEKNEMTERKNNYYKDLIRKLTPEDILPGVIELLRDLKDNNIKVAIGSSSKNAPSILKYIGLTKEFDAVVDGNNISHSKPHPEVFLKCAEALDLKPEECVVVEDAEAGVQAALAAKMKVLAVGFACKCCKNTATICREDLSKTNCSELVNL
ncbi:beta-phosphoglucomutase [Hathewaya proteolytica DSM 3090]|uniref:Beta-phosphoglucomutase n=1 Tax=Hathewaya proteolytica DSM 3090 TaxID=1121331 RepID=A0A1M6MQY9_9CLOT|nr:beta-phosphoglucomutase [Hathewaya proteolytica]SHJ85877.1 beta-phosphoglucomutase [Hathewaya proteolytica DSM 3090]